MSMEGGKVDRAGSVVGGRREMGEREEGDGGEGGEGGVGKERGGSEIRKEKKSFVSVFSFNINTNTQRTKETEMQMNRQTGGDLLVPCGSEWSVSLCSIYQ